MTSGYILHWKKFGVDKQVFGSIKLEISSLLEEDIFEETSSKAVEAIDFLDSLCGKI